MTRIPSLFVSHGGPNVVIDPSEARDYLSSLGTRLPRPRAIVIMSAHFETDGVSVVTDPAPAMIYDFGGFPAELYQMVYRAPGDPVLAERIVTLLSDAGLSPKRIARRGYDHGAWNPLILGWPMANIPVVQVSIDPSRDAAWHFAVGKALAPLREDGVLLIGSGHITHNLRAVFGAMRHGISTDPQMGAKVDAFTAWIADKVRAGDTAALLDWTRQAPFVAENHPTDEHFMPFFFALGAGGADAEPELAHASRQYGMFAWDSWVFH